MSEDSDSDTSTQDTDSSTSKNDKFEVCHVCKMNIPTDYTEEHFGSTIHKYHTKFTKTALDRSKDNLDKRKRPKASDAKIDYEYCAPCNVEYYYLDYSEHESTETHKKLVVYQKLLPRMYDLYKNTNKNLDLIDDIAKILKMYVPKPGNTVKNDDAKTYCEVCNIYKCSDGFTCHLRGQKHKKKCIEKNIPVPNIPKKTKEQKYCDVCCVYKSANNFDAHLASKKHMRKYLKLNKDESSSDESEVISLDKTTLTNGHEKYIDDFYGAKRCVLCDTRMSNDEDSVLEHINSEEHIESYKKILKLNNITKIGNEYFCPICTEIVPNVSVHIKDKHRKYINLGNGEYYCDICKVKVPAMGRLTHERGSKHKLNEKNLNRQKINYIDIEINAEFDRKLLTVIDYELTCFVCRRPLKDSLQLADHFNGVDHKFQMVTYAKNHGMDIESEHYRCKKCDEVVESKDIFEHLNSSDHKMKSYDHILIL